jgi:hypothetical protein
MKILVKAGETKSDTSDIRLRDKKELNPSDKSNDWRQQLESGDSVCSSDSVTCYTKTFYGEKDGSCRLETVILTIPNWDSIGKDYVSSILAIQRPDNLPVCSITLYNPAEFWGAIQVFDKCDACLRRKKVSSRILILIAIHWTKRRGPRITTNLNIFALVLPAIKRNRLRDVVRESSDKKVPVFCRMLHGNTQLWHHYARLNKLTTFKSLGYTQLATNDYSNLQSLKIWRHYERLRWQLHIYSGVLKWCKIFDKLRTLFKVSIYEKIETR